MTAPSFFAIAREILSPPHARDNAPWIDTAGQTDGILWAHPAAGRALMLTFDEAGRHHAATVFDGASVEATMVLHGRLFEVVRI